MTERTAVDDEALARVPKVARWLVVQGSLELLVALIVGVGWAMQLGRVVGELGRFQQAGFAGMAACALLSGSLKVAAGRRNAHFQAYDLGVAALWSGLISLATCYCFPSAAILLVYGLRIYSNPGVRRAFGKT